MTSMQTTAKKFNRSESDTQRGEELFCRHQDDIYRRTDRLFAYLMVVQWLAGIAAAIWISPRTWAGVQSQIHWHVWAAIFGGGIISLFPVALVRIQPGQVLTRHAIAVGQMLMSAMLIHLTGGRIETHFHVFGSLAFLAFYREWKVLLSATVVVAADHFARGVFLPQSVFGVLTASHWRWLEHAGWVVFEDIFLLISIHQSLQEMRLIANRQADLEGVNQNIEHLVRERTRELELEIRERKEAQEKLEQTHKQLLTASRQAGKAEVATNVLHNVGNVLNSVNVSASVIFDKVKQFKAANVGKAAGLMQEHAHDIGTFMANDPKGRQLPDYLRQLADRLGDEQNYILTEITDLKKNVDHIKDIVVMQQGYAKVSGLSELVKVPDLVEDALRMNVSALERHNVVLAREYDPHLPEITVEKHKVLQILVNLIRNAKNACEESGEDEKRLTVRVTNGSDRVRIAITDNGVGIAPENQTRIFNHGFTTRKDGHGFGLHSGALAAKEMGGTLQAHSEGKGRGATFTLELPVARPEVAVAGNKN